MTSEPLLALPDFKKDFVLTTDASKVGIGAVLSQADENGDLRPVGYAGRAFTRPESHYTTTEAELLASVWGDDPLSCVS